ncbi:helix-turn-helix transcriptional regulator [Bradyrhizobium sp.]|uniref:helix-turn-helix domain-containing protein n=1 Tax=Bradyrhizobium sp. TaxID=376 RepID=UPI0025BDBCE0|nr:helix-turn-helix transcriptional regulator [Bradyrhizobium sp.]
MKQVKHQDILTGRPRDKVVPEARRLRKQAGDWLKQARAEAGLSQADLAARLNLKYYTFISQVENGFSRVPTEIMGAWASELGLEQAKFAKHLLMYYEPELYRLLFGAESK